MKYGEAVKHVGKTFLSGKGQTLENYIAYMKEPGNKGDELSLHLCTRMCQKKVAVVTKTNVYYIRKLNNSYDDFIQISVCDMVLVYLGKGVFHGTKEKPFLHRPEPKRLVPRPETDNEHMPPVYEQDLCLRSILHSPWGQHHQLNHLLMPHLSPLTQRQLQIHLQPLPQKGKDTQDSPQKQWSRKKFTK